MIFAHFQTKRDITRGAKTLFLGGGGIGAGGWGALAPPVYMLKKALAKALIQIAYSKKVCHCMKVFLEVKLFFFRTAFKFLELQSSFLVKYT